MGEVLECAIAAAVQGNDAEVLNLLRPMPTDCAGNAEAWYVLGVAEHRSGHIDAAVQAYQQSLQLNPEHGGAILNLGKGLFQQKQWAEAERYLLRWSSANPPAMEVLFLLAETCSNQAYAAANLMDTDTADADAQRAIRHFESILQIDGSNPDALFGLMQQYYILRQPARTILASQFLARYYDEWRPLIYTLQARSLMHLGLFDAALAQIQKLESWADDDLALVRAAQRERAFILLWHCSPESVVVYEQAGGIEEDINAVLNYSLGLLATGRYVEGWKYYNRRMNAQVKYDVFDALPWRGESLQGKTLLLHSEQGAGDMIQFLRFLPMLHERGARVVFNTRPEILTLLEQDEHARKTQMGLEELRWDYHARLMDIPGLLDINFDNLPTKVPYLHPQKSLVEQWHTRMEGVPGFKVGIVWAGNPKQANDIRRSASLEEFAALRAVPGVSWFSLHKGSGEPELNTPHYGFELTDLAPELHSFADTAAAIVNLDLVITVDTSVAHLAGALSKPVWVVLPNIRQDWRWLFGRQDNPWYPTMRVFEQEGDGDWQQLFADRVIPALLAYLQEQVLAGAHKRIWRWLEHGARIDADFEAIDWCPALLPVVQLVTRRSHDVAVLQSVLSRLEADGMAESAEWQLARADLHVLRHESRQAMDLWEQLLCHSRIDVAHEALILLGRALQDDEQIDTALHLLDKGVERFAHSGNLHYLRGRALQFSGRQDESLLAYEQAISNNPRHFVAINNRALLLEKKGRLYDALDACQHLVQIQPQFAMGWQNLGRLALTMGIPLLAEHALRRVVQQEPDSLLGLDWLGNALFGQKKFAEAAEVFGRVLEKGATEANYFANYGHALYRLGEQSKAIEHYKQALQLEPAMFSTHFALAWHYLQYNQTEEGWYHFSQGTKKKETTIPAWQGEPLNGRHLLVYQDFGYGDLWQFMVLLRQLQGGKIIFAVNHQAVELVRAQGWGIEVIKMDDLNLSVPSEYDVQTNLMELPRLLHTDLLNPVYPAPYLHAPQDQVAKWKQRLAGDVQLKIGIVWAGNPKYGNDKNRSTRLSEWETVAGVAGVSLYSLQKDAASNQALMAPQIPLINIVAECETLADTAAVIANLDLVIAVDTGIAHLAGALGRPVWIMLANEGRDWRWQVDREDCPWYPSMRIFRQGDDESWKQVLSRVAAALQAYVQK